MTRFSADLSTLYMHLPFVDRFDAAVRSGFDAVEFPWPKDPDLGGLTPEQFARRVRESGLQVVALSLRDSDAGNGERGLAGDPSGVELFRRSVGDALAMADTMGCRKVSIPAGNVIAGQTADGQMEQLAQNIAFAADAAHDRGMTVLLGPLNPIEHPRYLLPTWRDAIRLIRRLNRPNVQIVLNVYEIAMAGDDPLEATAAAMGLIGHAQIADAPGRIEPGMGRLPIKDVLLALEAGGYGDAVGLAYVPSDDAHDPASVILLLGGNAKRDQDRLERIRTALAGAGLDAVVCLLPENVLALSGYWSMNGTCVALLARDSEPHLIVPRGEETWAGRSGWHAIDVYPSGRLADPDPEKATARLLSRAVEQLGLGAARIAVEQDAPFPAPPHMAHEPAALSRAGRAMLQSVFAGSELVSADELLLKERAVKTAREVAALRRTAAAADAGLAAFRAGIRPGARDIDLAADVERVIEGEGVRLGGATRVRAWAYVMSGPQTAQAYLSYEISTPRTMREGDVVLLELGVVADGYWNDLSRTYVVGEPDAEQARLHAAVEAAHTAALRAACAGATGGDVDAAARGVFERAGLAPYYPHGTGHGVGMAFHEPLPLLQPGRDHVLAEGMVIAVEPGLYVPGVGGFRNEDDALVTERGAIPLVSASHELRAEAM